MGKIKGKAKVDKATKQDKNPKKDSKLKKKLGKKLQKKVPPPQSTGSKTITLTGTSANGLPKGVGTTGTPKPPTGGTKPEKTPAQKETKKTPTPAAGKFKKLGKSIDPLIAILLVVVILVIGLAILYFFLPTASTKNGLTETTAGGDNSSDVAFCTSIECAHVASYITEHMDPDVDPCDDFYKSACGKFEETRYHSPDMKAYAGINRAAYLAEIEMMNMLNSNISKSEAETKAKIIYNACMKTATDLKGLYGAIQDIGGFPALDSKWDAGKFDLTDTILRMAEVMPDNLGFFKLDAASYEGKIINYMVYLPSMIELSEIGEENLRNGFYWVIFDHKYRQEVKFQSSSKQVLNSIANLNSLPVSGRWVQDVYEAIELDKRILAAKPLSMEQISILPKMHTFDMRRFVREVIPEETRRRENIRGDFMIYVPKCDYFEKTLDQILRSVEPRVLQNYLVLRFLFGLGYSSLTSDQLEHRKNYCVFAVKKLIPGTVGVAHAMRKIKKKNIAAAEKMVEDVKESFIEEFEENKWVDDKSKKKAIRKIKEMESYIGYPKHFQDEQNVYLKNLFKKFDLSPLDTFCEMAVKIYSSYSKDYFLAPYKNETTGFGVQIFQWSAFYMPYPSSLRVTSLPLQTPFFDASLPDYYNLGALGLIVGHEIGHGFHPDRQANVWSDATLIKFIRKAKCLKNKFGRFELHGKRVNGSQTLNENVADSFGLKVSFRTMKKKLAGKKNHEILRLPGMEKFTPEQVFYYGVATSLCEIPVKPEAADFFLGDTHTPNEFRLKGFIANSEDFAETFKCKPGTKMNPKNKCKIF